ncbi:MAG: nascent polypeptide-associated complex protein [Thermoplasmata archaeon]|nr:MAG: nascent polypeptide-associated complex protein [Thermoplasmata archaeon]
MIPGGRGLNPKHMKSMMKKHGINIEEMEDVEEVIIKTSSKTLVFRDAAVTLMDVQGQKTYQVVGNPEEITSDTGIPQEDIELVAQQAGVSEEEAKRALEECGGEPAEAIIKLMSEKS